MRIIKLGLALLASLSLAACGITGQITDPSTAGTVGAAIDATGATAPAPLGKTVIDEKGILYALDSADAIASAVDNLVVAGYIVPGTARAMRVKKALIVLRSVLTAASAAQKAGNATKYADAMREAAIAFREVSTAIAN